MKKWVLIILECMLIMTMFVSTAVPANAEYYEWYAIYENGVFTGGGGEGDRAGLFHVAEGQSPAGVSYSDGVLVLDNANISDLDLRGFEGKIVVKGNSTIGYANPMLIYASLSIYPLERLNPNPLKVEIIAEPGAKLTLEGGIGISRIVMRDEDGSYIWLQESQVSLGPNTKSTDPTLNYFITSEAQQSYINSNKIVIYYEEPTTVATTEKAITTKNNSSKATTKKVDEDKTTAIDQKNEKTTVEKTTETTLEETATTGNTSTKVETTKTTPQSVENESNTGKIIGICIGATAAIGGSAALFFFVIKPKFL